MINKLTHSINAMLSKTARFEITSTSNRCAGGNIISFNNKARAWRSFCYHAGNEIGTSHVVQLHMKAPIPDDMRDDAALRQLTSGMVLATTISLLLAEKLPNENQAHVYAPFFLIGQNT